MFFTILLLVFGILALVKGEFKITAKRKVKGSTSRILGVLLLVDAALSVLGGNWATIALLLFIAIVIAGIATAEKIEEAPKSEPMEETQRTEN